MTAAHSALVERIVAQERAALLEEAERQELRSRLLWLCDDAVEAASLARLRRVTEALEAMRWARLRTRHGRR